MSEPPNIARSTDEHAVERPVPNYSARARGRDDDAARSPHSHRFRTATTVLVGVAVGCDCGRGRGRDRRQQLADDLAPGLVGWSPPDSGTLGATRDRDPCRTVLPAVGRRSARCRDGRQSRERGSRLGAGAGGGERDQRAAVERTPGRGAPEPAVERGFAAERQHDRLQPLRARRQGLRDLRRDAVDEPAAAAAPRGARARPLHVQVPRAASRTWSRSCHPAGPTRRAR